MREARYGEKYVTEGLRAKSFLDWTDESVQARGLKNETVNMMENGSRVM